MRCITAIVLPSLLLAACAGPGTYGPGPAVYGAGPGGYGAAQPTGPYYGAPAGAYTGPEGTYSCDDLTTILVQPGVGIATATYNSGAELRLPHAGGGVYGGPSHNFRMFGSGGAWVSDGRPAVQCRLMGRSR